MESEVMYIARVHCLFDTEDKTFSHPHMSARKTHTHTHTHTHIVSSNCFLFITLNASHKLCLLFIISLIFFFLVKYSRYRPTWPRGVQEVKAPRFLDTRHMKVVRSLPLHTGLLYPQEYTGTHFLEAESTPGTWTFRTLSEKNSSVTRPGSILGPSD